MEKFHQFHFSRSHLLFLLTESKNKWVSESSWSSVSGWVMLYVIGTVVTTFSCWSHVSKASVTVSLAPVLVHSADLETFLFPPGKWPPYIDWQACLVRFLWFPSVKTCLFCELYSLRLGGGLRSGPCKTKRFQLVWRWFAVELLWVRGINLIICGLLGFPH